MLHQKEWIYSAGTGTENLILCLQTQCQNQRDTMFRMNSSFKEESFHDLQGMVRHACTSKQNSVNTEWLALITVSPPSPQTGCFIPISQEEKPPAHVITPPMPKRPTEEWQMAWAKIEIETVMPLCIVPACSLLPWSSQKQALQPSAQLRQPHSLGTTPSRDVGHPRSRAQHC